MPSKQRSKSPMRSSGKKRRKSTADSKNNNNKTVATKNSDDKNTRTIQIVVKKPDPTHDPYVVSFPGGLPEGLQPGSTASLPRFTIRKNRERSRSGKTVTGKDRTCEYTATNQGRAYDGRCTKVCVGVFDKKRGILTIQQAAEKGHVFAMEQSVPMYEPASLEDNMTSIDRYKALFDDFGSAKKRKVIKSKEANRVTADAVIGAGRVMQHAFLKSQVMSESNRKAIEADDDDDDNDNMNDAVATAFAEARRKFLPTFDADAPEPHMVYTARDIAGDDVWRHVSRTTDACIHKDDFLGALTGVGDWTDVAQTLLSIVQLDAPNVKNQIKAAILLNYALLFQQKKREHHRGSLSFIAGEIGLPKFVTERFLDLFMTYVDGSDRKAKYTTSKLDKDRLQVHILLLYMMAHGRTMKVGTIQPVVEAMRIGQSTAATLLREAGCTVQKQGGSYSVALKVPLTFPPPRRGRN